MTIHDDLREVMGLIAGLRQVAISDDVYAYCRQAGRVERECYGFVEKHGPALLARQEGEDDSARLEWVFGNIDRFVRCGAYWVASSGDGPHIYRDPRQAIDAARSTTAAPDSSSA